MERKKGKGERRKGKGKRGKGNEYYQVLNCDLCDLFDLCELSSKSHKSYQSQFKFFRDKFIVKGYLVLERKPSIDVSIITSRITSQKKGDSPSW